MPLDGILRFCVYSVVVSTNYVHYQLSPPLSIQIPRYCLLSASNAMFVPSTIAWCSI